MFAFNGERCLDTFQALLGIDSTTGQYQAVEAWTAEEIRRIGFDPGFKNLQMIDRIFRNDR